MAKNSRNTSIDWLRGAVMVLMALDHTRDFFSAGGFNPLDLTKTSGSYFLTRWITHFCAPVFVFLAGMAIRLAYLSAQKQGAGSVQQAKSLFLRGLWLVFLEVTLVRFGRVFDLSYQSIALQVIWAIGVAMMVMSLLTFLPWSLVGLVGLGITGLHNLLDGVSASRFEDFSWLWMILHEPNGFYLAPGVKVFTYYPVLPWVGVIALGYAFGELWLKTERNRSRLCWMSGGLLCIGFVALRLINLYGDPHPWSYQNSELFTVFSFINCTKYPPSLLYVLMTLGPALIVLGLIEKISVTALNPLVVFGRVPLFFYLIHLPVIHLAGDLSKSIGSYMPVFQGGEKTLFVGFGIFGIYVAWILLVSLLYIPSRWFGKVKQNSTLGILKYL